MSDSTQTIIVKAWNPQGKLAVHHIYVFTKFREAMPDITIVVGDRYAPFKYGLTASSIVRRFVPAAEAIGWTAAISVEGDDLPSKHSDGDLIGMEYVWGLDSKRGGQ